MTKIEIFSLTACFRYVFLEKNPLNSYLRLGDLQCTIEVTILNHTIVNRLISSFF